MEKKWVLLYVMMMDWSLNQQTQVLLLPDTLFFLALLSLRNRRRTRIR